MRLPSCCETRGSRSGETTDAQRAMAVDSNQTLVVAYPQLLPRAAVRDLEVVNADVVLLGPVSHTRGLPRDRPRRQRAVRRSRTGV